MSNIFGEDEENAEQIEKCLCHYKYLKDRIKLH